MYSKNLVDQVYSERISSTGTSLLFLFLAILFFLLFGWRVSVVGWRFFLGVLLFLGVFFTIYVVNYRVLEITITYSHLKLRFGIVPWKTSLENIQAVELDDSPALIKFGGAGVHFAFVNGKYRAFYNFLEYPRLLVYFREKQGLVQALVFSTRKPDKIQEILESRITPLPLNKKIES